MKSYKIFAVVATIAMFCNSATFAQSTEIRFLKGVNPRYPTNNYYKAFSSTAKPVTITIPFCMLAISLINDNRKAEQNAYEIASGVVIAAVATEALKIVINRPRPYLKYNDIYPDEIDDGSSFPSGHTAIAFATATSVLLTAKKWYYVVPAYMWASGVGYSRIYLGQHYPSDVFAGAVVGAAGAYASHWLTEKIFLKKKNKG